jgi:hypothetical protein
MTDWEYFTRDSFGHELVYEKCAYCMVERPVQLWSIAEEDSDADKIATITLSYPFQIKQLMKELNIHGKSRWVCLDCYSEIEQRKQNVNLN